MKELIISFLEYLLGVLKDTGGTTPETPSTEPTGSLQDKVIYYIQKSTTIPEKLKVAFFAQMMLETGRFTSKLATDHNNFGGLKMRDEYEALGAVSVGYLAHDGLDDYAKFPSIEAGVNGQMACYNRSHYNGWRAYEKDPIGFLTFIKSKGYAESPDYVSKIVNLFEEAAALLRMDVAPVDDEAELPRGEKLLWYPGAKKNVGGSMKTLGTYAKGYPLGAVVHYTAGRCETEQDAINTLNGGISGGLCYFMVGPTGVVYQNFPLNRHGSHAGDSAWSGIGGRVSDDLVGIEVACAGEVDSNGKSWFGVTYAAERLRRIVTRTDNQSPGNYVKMTSAQEQAVFKLLLWLKRNNPGVFSLDFVLGHDEVSGPKGIGRQRKVDPGGSLSMTMSDLRKDLKAQV